MKATHAITTESDVRYKTTRRNTRYENEMENDTRPEIQSVKATHAMKGNSKEVSQPSERLPERKEGWRQEPRPCSATKAGTAPKTQVYMPSRGMNGSKSDLISDPDVDKAFKF